MHRLGGHVLGFSDAKNTRAGDFYQESIKDTVHMLEYYGDVIAMRHFQQGAPAEAAQWASVPVINCGDGWGEHPTQVLTDLYTTQKEMGSIDGLHVPARRRHAHADDALDPVRALAVRREGVRRRAARDVAPARVHARARRAQRPSTRSPSRSRTCIAECDVIYMEPVVQPDYTKSRDERGGGEFATTPAEYRSRAQLLREKAKTGLDRPAQPAADGRAARRTSTRRATRATGPRRSTAS